MDNSTYSRRSGLAGLGLLILAVLAIVAPMAQACQTPVFRYALEKWPGDYYPLMIYHDKPLTADQKAIVDWLEEFQESEGAQVSVYVLDVSKKPTTQPATSRPSTQPATQPEQSRADAQREYLLKKFPAPKDVAMPAMVLRYPARRGPEGAVWPVVHSGKLDGKLAQNIIDSPARRKVAKRLLSGDSAVWVLLESGDKKKDDAAAKTLEEELARMNEELQLPEQAPAPDIEGYEDEISVELKLAFTVLRISRTDPAERMFVKMLLGSEEGLDKEKGPMAFPIFGRGRALAAFVGEGINDEQIEDASIFLVGKCSCQVKNLNPGTDIMFSVNWDAALAGQPMMSTPEPPKLATDVVDAVDVTLKTASPTIGPATQPADKVSAPAASSGMPSMPVILGLSAAGLLVVVVLPMVWVMRKGAGR